MGDLDARRTARLRNLGRLIGPMDVAYQVGNFIYRRSMRYTLFTAGLGLLGVLANWIPWLPGISVKQAIMLPLLIGGGALVGGFLLRLIPSLISRRLQVRAQGSDLNLMEDLRKAQGERHLEVLWTRLFAHEHHGFDHDEFMRRARDAMESNEPQLRQMHRVGLDLRYLEDWCDGAYFDRADTHLRDQFDGSATLLTARRDAGLLGVGASMRMMLPRSDQRFWWWFTTRAIAMQVAGAVDLLNLEFDTELVNAQVLLWPGEEDDPWLARFEGASELIVAERTALLRRVFGPDMRSARELLDHMLYPFFGEATWLRMRFDPEYCTGALGYDVTSDLGGREGQKWQLRRARRFVRPAREGLARFDVWVEEHRATLLEPGAEVGLRAARCAFHVDKDGLRRLVLGGGRAEIAGSIVDAVVADAERWSVRLVAVRLHHELARLHRQEYEALVRTLAYPDG